VELEGSLAVFEPVIVFQVLNMARVTGELSLDAGHNSAHVFFEDGDVVFAGIDHRSVKLGEYLVSTKVITQKQLDSVLIRDRRGKRLGGLLVENGILEEDDLRIALEEQVKEVIYEVVKWARGWFRFKQGKDSPSTEVVINIPLQSLMLEGVKRMDEAEGDPVE
jgi:hypothetical protein